MKQQRSDQYRGYRTAGIRLSEDLAPAHRLGREFGERASLYAFHMFDKAHLVMMTEEAIISRAHGAAMLRALREMEQEGMEDVRSTIGGGMHSGEVYLIRKLGEEVGGWEHLGRSSVDLGAVGSRIRERDRLLEVLEALNGTREAVLKLAGAHLETVFPGYFSWQHAQPISLGHYLVALASGLERDFERGRECYGRVNRSPAGSVVMTGSALPLDRARTARLLGFDAVHVNTLDAALDQDHVHECFAVLGMLAAHLSRFGEDLAVWSGTDFGLIDVADRFAAGSSILMQMKTPIVWSQMKGGVAGGMVSGYLATKTATGMGSLDRRYADEPFNAAFQDVTAILNLLPHALGAVSVDAERARASVDGQYTAATDLAGLLVAERGVPWRTAHQICGILFRHCSARGVKPDQLTPEMVDEAAVEYFGKPMGLSQQHIREGLDADRFLKRRTGIGGPAPEEAARQIGELGRTLAADMSWVEGRRLALADAAGELERAIDVIVG
ncbi:MAG: argininosuccinate lyase [Chloroflexota bacterium]